MDASEETPYRKPGGRGQTEAGARKALELYRSGHTYAQIKASLVCSLGTVHNICKGEPWAWLRKLVEEGK